MLLSLMGRRDIQGTDAGYIYICSVVVDGLFGESVITIREVGIPFPLTFECLDVMQSTRS